MTNATRAWLYGAGVGAGTMFLLDPGRGRRRRAVLRDKLGSAQRKTFHAAAVTGRDLRHRLAGVAAQVRNRKKEREVDDDVLVARVRSAMGRHVSHPSVVTVTSKDGYVTLEGPVLAREVDELIETICKIPGVREVQSCLDVHDNPGGVPGLHGGNERGRSRRLAFRPRAWSPTARLVAGAGGTGLIAWGLTRWAARG